MNTSTDVLVHGLQSPPVHLELVKVLKDFYVKYYDTFKERGDGTGDASGIVGLSQLLEGEDGLLNAIINRRQFLPLFEKKNEYEGSLCSFKALAWVIRSGRYSQKLANAVKRFKEYRNMFVHPLRYPYPQHVDAATKAFLDIVEEYYREYQPGKRVQSIFDLSIYHQQLAAGTYLLGRYEIVQYLGSTEKSNIYKVKDRIEPGRAAMVAKIFFNMSSEDKVSLERERSFGSTNQGAGESPYINEYLGSEVLGKDSVIVFRRFIEGGGLTSWFAKGFEKEDFPYRLMSLVGTLLQGLRGIHEKGYVYGSILPQHIVVDSLDAGWLIEFTRTVKVGEGLVKIPQEAWKQFGMKKTPVSAHPSIDIHMLGMLLHRLLVRVESGEVKLPLSQDQIFKAYQKQVSPEMIDFVNRCTTENLTEKFKSAGDALAGWNQAFEKQTAYVEKTRTGPVTYGLVSCSRRKTETDRPIPARELYSASPDFQRWLRWSEKHCDKTLIVSGKYGLVEPAQYLPNYNVDLRHYPVEGQEAWARFIVYALLNQGISSMCEVHICADSLYRSLLQGELERHHIRVVAHEWKDEAATGEKAV